LRLAELGPSVVARPAVHDPASITRTKTMLRYAIYSIVLVAFIYVLGHGLNGVFISERPWPFLMMAGILCSIILILAFLWDRIDRQQQSDESNPPDHKR
jgi:uncharacterized membrane protein